MFLSLPGLVAEPLEDGTTKVPEVVDLLVEWWYDLHHKQHLEVPGDLQGLCPLVRGGRVGQ